MVSMIRDKEDKLQHILHKMDVPDYRTSNYPWLVHNLGQRNSNHESYREALSLLMEILLEKNLLRKKERRKIEQELQT